MGDSPGRAALLTFEPGAKAVEMEDMAAGQLLWSLIGAFRGVRALFVGCWLLDHLFPTDDARPVGHGFEFLGSRIGVTLVHVPCRRPVAVQCT